MAIERTGTKPRNAERFRLNNAKRITERINKGKRYGVAEAIIAIRTPDQAVHLQALELTED